MLTFPRWRTFLIVWCCFKFWSYITFDRILLSFPRWRTFLIVWCCSHFEVISFSIEYCYLYQGGELSLLFAVASNFDFDNGKWLISQYYYTIWCNSKKLGKFSTLEMLTLYHQSSSKLISRCIQITILHDHKKSNSQEINTTWFEATSNNYASSLPWKCWCYSSKVDKSSNLICRGIEITIFQNSKYNQTANITL